MNGGRREGFGLSRFRELLLRLFRYYGFESGEPDEGPVIHLRKGSLAVEVVAVEEAPELGEAELGVLFGLETKAARRIVVSLGRFTDGARRLAEKNRVQLWDRARIEEETGRMVLAEVDTREAPSADESMLEPFLEGNVGGLGEPPNAVSGGLGASGLAGARPVLDLREGESMVAPKIAQDQARSLIAERLEGAFRFDLQMMPHYCYTYSCEVEGPRGRIEARHGTVLVNGMTGTALDWKPAKLSRPEATAIRMEPSVEEGRAHACARDWAVSSNTRIVHHKRDKGTVTVYEKLTLRPSPEAVRLELLGLLYLPAWCIEGGNGAVVMDALDGHIIKEELFHSVTAGGAPGPGNDEGHAR